MPSAKARKIRSLKLTPEAKEKPFVSALSVLVCHERAGSRYYVVANDDDLFKHSLSILRGRLISDWYECPGEEPAPLDYVKDDVGRMPPSFRDEAYDRLRRYGERLSRWKAMSDLWERIQEACSSADGRLAWSVLRDRNEHERERVSLHLANPAYEYTVKDYDPSSED